MEEYQILKNIVLSQSSGKAIQTIMIAGAVNNEGCSTVAVNLAETMAKNGSLNVCLIDANLRRPALHEAFQSENSFGLTDIILKGKTVAEVMKKTKFPNLSVILSGKNSAEPASIFEAHKMKEFILNLKESFDYIIFDSAPVNAYPDAQFLATRMDGVIFVVRAEKTRWEVVYKAKERVQISNARILGAVLNRKRYLIPKFLYENL